MRIIAKSITGGKKYAGQALILFTAVLMFLLLITGTTSWANDYRVVTMYFAGTGATHIWWNADMPVDFEVFWQAELETYFEKPELLATLHRHQIASGSGFYNYPQHEFLIPESGINLNHRKFFINGVGTSGAPADRLEDRKDAGRAGALWGWAQINAQAETYLKTITESAEEGIILNVVGWSRGGPSAIMFARLVAMENKNGGPDNIDMFQGKVKRINIMAFDPVIGNTSGDCSANPTLLKPENFDFTGLDIVNQYVGIYSWDERSVQFAPLMPIGIEKTLVFSLPGSHETMVGNVHNSGHSVKGEWDYGVWWPCAVIWSEGWPFNPPLAQSGLCRGRSHPIDKITSVSDFSALLAMKFLGSPEWGGARFDNVINLPWANTEWFITLLSPPFVVETHFINTYFADYESVFTDYLGGSKTFLNLFETYTSRFLAYGGYSYMRYIAFVPWVAGGSRYSADDDRPYFLTNTGSEEICYTEGFLDDKAPLLNTGNRWDIYDNVISMMGKQPVANAGPDRILLTGGTTASVTLDGSGSYDPDNSPLLAYEWTDCGTGAIFASGYDLTNPTVVLSPGTHNICLKMDDAYYSDSDTVQIRINKPPMANAGTDQTVYVNANCMASVTLDGSGSYDADGDPLQYTWTGIFGSVTGINPTVSMSPGLHKITLTVSDGMETGTDTVNVTVSDTTPPVIKNLTASPKILWPANHKMMPITVNASASDNCGNPLCKISSVSSNEPVNGLGDGDMSPDWKVTGNLALKLRAERSGKGSGRIYTIAVMCADAAGNSSSGNVNVNVPHDRGKK
ncbi:MAG: hypothetical protein FJ241_09605 [Nitrospira sp.]|nr:hypothetical protein [Nitrospira sp.]